jgi:ADP-ribose pyrophosphatase YjhB (NUDIX family)
MRAKKISIDNAKTDKLFYFVVNVVVYRESDQKCLILKRSTREIVHPGKWAVPGGKLEWNDLDLAHPTRLNGDVIDFEDAVAKLMEREVFEEAGVEIQDQVYYLNDMAFIRPDEIPVVLIKFAAIYKSGQVKVEKGSFDDFAWVDREEVKHFPCIKGVPNEIAQTIELFSGK